MYRTLLRSRLGISLKPSTRSIHLSTITRASKPAHEPASTQGHATDKAHQTLHKDSDVQSAAVRAGQDAKDKAETKSGEDEPFDAARQGSTGGEVKGHGTARGAFKDQVGGQDEEEKGQGVVKGKSTPAAGYNITETVANKVKGGFDSLKQMRSDERNFSTSLRAYNGTTPRADADGSRKPVEQEVHGDQNPHLKHTSGGSQGKSGSGNASPDPSLPSKKSAKAKADTSTQTRSFSTSLRVMADPNTPAGDAPISGQKEAQSQTGLKQQPRGTAVEHGGAAGAPSQGSAGAPEASTNPAGTAAPDPGLSKGEQQTAKKANQTRSFSTSSRSLADPNTPSGNAPISSQKDAQSQAGLRQQPRGQEVEHGGATGAPSQGSAGAPEGTPNGSSGTAAPDPGVSKKEKEGAVKDGMGVRSFSTSTRARSEPSPAHSKAIPSGSAKAGYDAPPTALPSNLKSPYQEVDPNAVQSPDAGLKASSEVSYSSTAQDPPNQALRQAVLDGSMEEKNPQPDVSGTETGRQGIDEAWKHRK